MVILAPFGGDTFKLCNWDNARCNFSNAKHPIFQNEAERKRPFVAPEIAETAPDAEKKPTLSTAVDIWSLGVLTFILRTACLPLNRDSQTGEGDDNSGKFDPKDIVNSPQYSRIFDDDQKDFLIKCMQFDPKQRATVDELLNHAWITNNQE